MEQTERMLVAYTEAEPWKADHDNAMRTYVLEKRVAIASAVFEVITQADARWGELVLAGYAEYSEEQYRFFESLYRRWLEAAERDLESQKAPFRDYVIRGADAFRLHIEEARSILVGREIETEMRPADVNAEFVDRPSDPDPDGLDDREATRRAHEITPDVASLREMAARCRAEAPGRDWSALEF